MSNKKSDVSTKGIFENNCNPLPDSPYVSLTEAVTWIAMNDCRDDYYLVSENNKLVSHNMKEWFDIDGPMWLLPHLDLLRNNQAWSFSNEIDEESKASTLKQFAGAKKWLKEKDRKPQEAYQEVLKLTKERYRENLYYEMVHQLIWNSCASKQLTMLGIPRDPETEEVTGIHEEIPYTYFLRPVWHWMGVGYHDHGELSPAEMNDEDVLDFVFNFKSAMDKRPCYLKPMILSEQLEGIKDEFLKKSANSAKSINCTPRGRKAHDFLEIRAYLMDQYNNNIPEKISTASLLEQVNSFRKSIGKKTTSADTIDRVRGRRTDTKISRM